MPKLIKWFSESARDLPWRRTPDPYGVFVSEIMLQQTQVKTVVPYWERWMRALPTLESLATAEAEHIHKLWEGLGYYSRVRNLQRAAQIIQERHQGVFPDQYEAVLELPGVGRYTAGAICSIAFNQPRPILDGNVIRVLTRLFGIGGNPREKRTNTTLWRLAERLVLSAAERPTGSKATRGRDSAREGGGRSPARACSCLNQSLMELGALVCVPRQPDCQHCPVAGHCVALQTNRIDSLPNLGRRARTTARRFVAFVAERAGRFLVCQRPSGVVNAHLWEFPNVELVGNAQEVSWAAKAVLGRVVSELERVCVIKHSITRFRITLEVFRVPAGESARLVPERGKWLTLQELEALPFCGAHRKIRSQVMSLSLGG